MGFSLGDFSLQLAESVVVAPGLSCPEACGILLHQGSIRDPHIGDLNHWTTRKSWSALFEETSGAGLFLAAPTGTTTPSMHRAGQLAAAGEVAGQCGPLAGRQRPRRGFRVFEVSFPRLWQPRRLNSGTASPTTSPLRHASRLWSGSSFQFPARSK